MTDTDTLTDLENRATAALKQAKADGLDMEAAWDAVKAEGVDPTTAWDFVRWAYEGTASDLVNLADK